MDSSIKILGASSDHMILDVTDCELEIQVGSIIEFNMDYGGMLDLYNIKVCRKKLKGKILPFSFSIILIQLYFFAF